MATRALIKTVIPLIFRGSRSCPEENHPVNDAYEDVAAILPRNQNELKKGEPKENRRMHYASE